jgi:cation:H+ antiporter
VPDIIIGLTLVAIGTSLPEVATSLVAVFRGNTDIAIGNVIGSNLFNLLGIAGITAMVRPLEVPDGMMLDFGFMIALTVALLPMVWRPPHDIKRWEAGILIGLYVLYIATIIFVPNL